MLLDCDFSWTHFFPFVILVSAAVESSRERHVDVHFKGKI